MARRVRIQGGQAATLQVSLPGYDVTTATLDQMAFDARFANMGIVAKGQIYVPHDTWTTLYFPKTYLTIPRMCAIFVYNQGGQLPLSVIGYGGSPGCNLTTVGGFTSLAIAQVTTSSAQFFSSNASTDPSIQIFASAYVFFTFYR